MPMSYDASQSMDWSAMSAAEFENRVTAQLQRVHPRVIAWMALGGDGGIISSSPSRVETWCSR